MISLTFSARSVMILLCQYEAQPSFKILVCRCGAK
jgi:hypothetical protein